MIQFITVNKSETIVFLGKSGCGKTTTLKMINKLITPSSGEIFIDGRDINLFNPVELRRNIGYAIQSIGLFNHMTIKENISVVPRLLNWDKNKIENRVDELLEFLRFIPSKMKDLYPRELSGGQKQRVGVARALAADPEIILMDEPFGALDSITREKIQDDFIELESYIKKTVVFVTHDISEAVKMADRIALMDNGHIIQVSSPDEFMKIQNGLSLDGNKKNSLDLEKLITLLKKRNIESINEMSAL